MTDPTQHAVPPGPAAGLTAGLSTGAGAPVIDPLRPDRAPPWPAEVAVASSSGPVAPAASLGALELLLPLWHRRWRLLVAVLLGAALAFAVSLLVPLRFAGSASFVVQPQLRPSQAVVAGALPQLAGLVGAGGGAVDLYGAMLRSQAMTERILERFDLQRSWGLAYRTEAQREIGRRVTLAIGRREGLVQITVLDETPQRAAAIANQYVTELRQMLQAFALDEARQRRAFYDAQLQRARAELLAAQQKLQASGVDRGALRAQPALSLERYARMGAELAAAEQRLAATLRVRTEASAEVQQQRAELSALRQQLTRLEVPRDQDDGHYVGLLRSFRQAEAMAESIARQAEAARVDEAAEVLPLQVLDLARPAEWPASPRPVLWALAGGLGGLLLAGGWVLLRHRRALARLDLPRQQRLALLRAVISGQR